MARERTRLSLTGAACLCAIGVLAADTPAHFRAAGRLPAAQTALLELRAAPLPLPGRADVAVHVPRGFDPARRPGALVYFHGWNGCVGVALADQDAPCTQDGPTRHASHLAAQLDDAAVNAILVAVELRADAPSGEVGALAQPGALRALLAEVLTEHLAPRLGVLLGVDTLDPIVVVAHSGGYQAAAASLRFGDLPRLREVVLLDSLYGADAVFDAAVGDRSMRVVNLYTYSGGTRERSLRLAALARAHGRDLAGDDEDDEPSAGLLSHAIVVKRVPVPHAELPQTYTRTILSAAGFSLAP